MIIITGSSFHGLMASMCSVNVLIFVISQELSVCIREEASTQ